MASQKYEDVKRYYKMGLWDKRMLKNAVRKKWITEGEYQVLTGSEYNAEI